MALKAVHFQRKAQDLIDELTELVNVMLKDQFEDNDPQSYYLRNAIYEVQKRINGTTDLDMKTLDADAYEHLWKKYSEFLDK